MIFQTTITGSEPISLDAVKSYIRAIPDDVSEDADIINPLISAAREFCENYTGRSLVPQTITAYPEHVSGKIYLPRSPLTAIQNVTADGVAVEYTANMPLGWVELRELPQKQVEIIYQSDPGQIPFSVRQAMLLLIAHWYENREAVAIGAFAAVEVELAAKALLNQNKNWWF